MNRTTALLAAISIAAVPGIASAASDGKDRHVIVRNISSQAVYYLYASPVTSDTWEEDLLGDRTIPPGDSINADIDNGTDECIYDLKVELKDGKEYVQREVNVCAVSSWIIGDSGDVID